jgi:hypothetical protein
MTAETADLFDRVHTGAAQPEGRRSRPVSDLQRRRVTHARNVTSLLSTRPDLAGVHAPADLTAALVLWCV